MNFNSGASVLLFSTLAMLVPFLCLLFFLVPTLLVQSSTSIAATRALDAMVQDNAYKAFVRPKTEVLYNGIFPSNLNGIQIATMMLRSGSLRTRGVKMYKEFQIPTEVVEQPYVERLILVYQNLGNWYLLYYSLPNYNLAPILGLLAYNASDLSVKNLSGLDLRTFRDPIRISFSYVESASNGLVPKCLRFDLLGSGHIQQLYLTAPNE
ncbi:hypothetical protein V6N13_048449 [Hibiscus sabdariffa]|uniref:Transmembrane protein n=1 Tax=Hibiscus sabdariffa TaxID=183260 RepID=A0ABR2F785_9ROSI